MNCLSAGTRRKGLLRLDGTFAPVLQPRAGYNFRQGQPKNSDAISPLCRKWTQPASTRLNVELSRLLAVSAGGVPGVTPTRLFVQFAALPSVIAVSLTMPAAPSHERA